MLKEELRESGGDPRQAADQYIDTIVTNAVLGARGGLDVRQRDASRASLVASSDPTGNDNRSNRTTQQSVRDTDSQRRHQHDCSESDDDDDDDDCDDSDDGATRQGDTRDTSDSVVRGRTCSAATDDRHTELVKGRRQATNDRQEDSGQCDRTSDSEHSTEGSPSSRSKYAAKGNHVRQDQNKEDSSCGKSSPCDGERKRKENHGRECKDCGRETCKCDAAADEHCDERKHHVTVSRCSQSTSINDDDRRRTTRPSDQTRPRDQTQRRQRKTRDSYWDKKTAPDDDFEACRCRDVPTDSDDDVLRCLRRRDDESIDSYLTRSILLLGNMASQSNDVDNECNSSAGAPTRMSYDIDQALEQAVESIKRAHSPARADQSRHNSRRQYKTPLTQWSRTSNPSHVRFSTVTGSRYSGSRQSYSKGGGSAWSQSSVPKSNSFNTIQLAGTRVADVGLPRRSSWKTGTVHSYQSNRSDRDRFAARSSRCSAGNVNMHSNQTHDAETRETADAACNDSALSVRAADTEEVNTNNSRLAHNDDRKTTTASDSSDFIPACTPRHAELPTNNNSSNNNNCLDNDDKYVCTGNVHAKEEKTNRFGFDAHTDVQFTSNTADKFYNIGDGDYQSATWINSAECTLFDEQDDVNYSVGALIRRTAYRRGRRVDRRRSDEVRLSTVALRDVRLCPPRPRAGRVPACPWPR